MPRLSRASQFSTSLWNISAGNRHESVTYPHAMEDIMLTLSTVFFTIACFVAILAFLDISTQVTKVSKKLCYAFLALFTVTLVAGLFMG